MQQTGGGLLLANFPRDREQLRMLRMFAPPPEMVISLTAPRDELDMRVRYRRVCGACAAPMYPPADAMMQQAAAAAKAQGKPLPPRNELYAHLVESGCTEPTPRRLPTDEGAALAARWR
eukprot:5702047-Prymnesium_polylepis.1